MSRQSESVKLWRKNTKSRIIESMGGNCLICGYSKCNESLALHHLEPSEKEFGFGAIRANPVSWAKIVIELRKCILVCHNCHGEIHHGDIFLDKEIKSTYNEKYDDYVGIQKELLIPCVVCGKLTNPKNTTCSKQCAGKLSRNDRWKDIDLIDLKKTMTNVAIAEKMGISEAAVRKRYLKIMK